MFMRVFYYFHLNALIHCLTRYTDQQHKLLSVKLSNGNQYFNCVYSV